jgi:integrase
VRKVGSDVELRERTLSVNRTLLAAKGGPVFGRPKSSKSRRKIFLARKSDESLRRHGEHQTIEKNAISDCWQNYDLVLCSSIGTPLSRHNLGSRSFKLLLRRADLPDIRFPELRNTHATLQLSKNAHPKLVQGVADAMDKILP